MLIEKAWAMVKGGYQRLDLGGTSADAMEGIAGAASREEVVAGFTEAQLLEKLGSALSQNKAVTTGSLRAKTPEMDALGIIAQHGYAVIAVDAAKQEIRLQNPWGPRFGLNLPISVYRSYFRVFAITAVQ